MEIKNIFLKIIKMVFLVLIFFSLLINIKFTTLMEYPIYSDKSILLNYFVKFWGNTQIKNLDSYYILDVFSIVRPFIVLFLGIVFSTFSFMSTPSTYSYFTFYRKRRMYDYCISESYLIIFNAIRYVLLWVFSIVIYVFYFKFIENISILFDYEVLKLLVLHTILMLVFICNMSFICLILNVLYSKLIGFIVIIGGTLFTIYLDLKLKSINIILFDYNSCFIDSFIIQIFILVFCFLIYKYIYKLYILKG